MTEKDQNWKKHLLRTSAPLEHDAARVLSEQGFSVSAYSYNRMHEGVDKEFAVDVRGVKLYGPSSFAQAPAAFDLLVECKYRERGAKWLFLPQPRGGVAAAQNAIQYVDLFSPHFVHDVWWFEDGTQLSVCYGGVEVGRSGGDDDTGARSERSRESQLKHGARQLQYALPSLILQRAGWVMRRQAVANFPFFFVPILLTNATLLVAARDFGVASVEAATTVDDIGRQVSHLLWSAELGPDFTAHAQRQLASLTRLTALPRMKEVEEARASVGVPQWLQPSEVATRILEDGSALEEVVECTNILVVNVNAFTEVVATLSATVQRMVNSVTDQPLVKW